MEGIGSGDFDMTLFKEVFDVSRKIMQYMEIMQYMVEYFMPVSSVFPFLFDLSHIPPFFTKERAFYTLIVEQYYLYKHQKHPASTR